jgi:hypothetical protein
LSFVLSEVHLLNITHRNGERKKSAKLVYMQFSLGSREYGGLILDLDILVVQILIHSNV